MDIRVLLFLLLVLYGGIGKFLWDNYDYATTYNKDTYTKLQLTVLWPLWFITSEKYRETFFQKIITSAFSFGKK